jgi:hypothetical protein
MLGNIILVEEAEQAKVYEWYRDRSLAPGTLPHATRMHLEAEH